MLGFLLARAGLDVVVLEKHADFFRDFRGDTIHPSTLNLMNELGLLDEFLTLPHDELKKLAGVIGDTTIALADFSHVPACRKFLAFMPQWDFLNFLVAHGTKYPGFHVMMEADAVDLLYGDKRIAGVRVQADGGPLEIEAKLVVAADGRHSTLRDKGNFTIEELGAPMDVLWMRLSRHPTDPAQTLGYIRDGHMLVALNRTTYWQCAMVIPKGSFAVLQSRGLDAFRSNIVRLAPFLANSVAALHSWDDVKLLTVAVNRLHTWYRDGLLCIGDAAHAMSPIGGVGINLAIQDAVAAANILAAPLLRGTPTLADLCAVQQRREFPARATQSMQVFVQNHVVTGVLNSTTTPRISPLLRLTTWFPVLQRIPAYVVGIGFRPEHIRTPAA
jgi:2-polyprenyl-6-methoxyphenol hydroxylase-like FAD-dependent oxidoreductase